MATATTAPPADRTVDLRTPDGGRNGTVTLAGVVFGIEPNEAVLHQVVTAQRAAARAGTHSTKTRAEVRGGGAKPYRQKGTGRARQGSIRAPHYTGGGVAHGPKPRDYSQRTPKKMVRLALRSALSDRAAGDRVVVVDGWGFEEPKTRAAKSVLDALEVPANKRALVVLGPSDDHVAKSFANLAGERRVQTIDATQLNAYEVMVAEWLLLSRETLELVTERLSQGVSRPAGRAAAGADGAAAGEPAADDATTEGGDGA